jgi:hypothetical protein
LFKKAAVFTDIHFGLKGNSRLHNDDCEEFVDWFIEQAKENNCETAIFCGDWHHNRNSLNLTTMDATIRSLEKLGAAFENFYMFVGNHDLYYKDKRDVASTIFGKHIKGVTFVDEILEEDDVALVPWLVGDEWKKMEKIKAHYIGNAFPHNYADAWDDDRGMMIIDKENDTEPEYINWWNCPKYRTVKLSDLLNKTEEIIKPKMYLRVTLDLPVSYEEANFLKETFISQYKCREITLIPQKSIEEITSDVDIEQFESVDQIVANEIAQLDTQNFNKNVLLEIYNGLEHQND